MRALCLACPGSWGGLEMSTGAPLRQLPGWLGDRQLLGARSDAGAGFLCLCSLGRVVDFGYPDVLASCQDTCIPGPSSCEYPSCILITRLLVLLVYVARIEGPALRPRPRPLAATLGLYQDGAF